MDKVNENSAPKKEQPFSTYEFESNSILETDAMGREKFWEDLGRKND
jgi:hypothetical protein